MRSPSASRVVAPSTFSWSRSSIGDDLRRAARRAARRRTRGAGDGRRGPSAGCQAAGSAGCAGRPPSATAARFPQADQVVVDWPDRHLSAVGSDLGPRDAICVLTHDPKFDVPAIVAALRTRCGYLGAMGSRRTHADRVARLKEAGVNDDELARVMGPIGLAIG